MKTPITDKVFTAAAKLNPNPSLMNLGILARRLELDRAALIGALKACLAASYDGPMPDYAREAAAAALSAARANFPD